MNSGWSRRGLFIVGGRVIAGATLALAVERAALAEDGIDWKHLFADKPAGGSGVVKQVTGSAFANQRSLSTGAKVKAGEQLRVARGGSLVVSVEDGTLLSLKESTVMDFSPTTRKTGAVNLIAGALLAILPVGNHYLVGGPTATIGIKGTVIYRQVFTENQHTARAMEGKTATVPGRGMRDYFCTCNGAVDYLRNHDKSLITSDTAQHHNAFMLNPENPKLLERFEMVNHFDRDIKAAIDLQDGPKHDMSFLKL